MGFILPIIMELIFHLAIDILLEFSQWEHALEAPLWGQWRRGHGILIFAWPCTQ
jgi:hypothetical protein